MFLIKRIITFLIKISIIFLVVTFEKVIGLPLISITLFLIFFVKETDFYGVLYLVLTSFFLALAYDFSFTFSLIILISLIFGINYGSNIIANDISRVFLLIFIAIVVIALVSNIMITGLVIAYFVISTIIIVNLLLKTIFSKHGLIGMSTRGSFFK